MFNSAFILSDDEIRKIRVEIIQGKIVGKGKMRYVLYDGPPSIISYASTALLDLPATAEPRLACFFGGGPFGDEIMVEVGGGWQSGMELYLQCNITINTLRRHQRNLPTGKPRTYEKRWLELYGQILILRAVVKKLARTFNRRSAAHKLTSKWNTK